MPLLLSTFTASNIGEGVQSYIDDTLNGYEKVGSAKTEWFGEAGLDVWLPGCPGAEFEMYVVAQRGIG